MAVYGQYETVAELGRSGSVTVYRARPADGGWELGFDELGSDANFALKVFQPRSAEDAGAAERRRFLERVRAQKRAFDAGSRHWAPIFDAGESRGQAFYATEFFPRTAEKLSGPAIDPHSLYGVVEGVLLGLIELKRTQGRPHGNLKPSNVMVRGASGDVTSNDVALADPALDNDATIAGEPEDLYCLGEMIYALVLGQKFQGQRTWPVQPSHRWDALGKYGEAWRGLCNHLLSPRAAENWIRAEDVLDEVQTLRPKGGGARPSSRKPGNRRARKVLAAAVLALALAGGLGTFQYFRFQRQWRELCSDYNAWFGPIVTSLEKQTPKAVANDLYLSEQLVKPLAGARTGETPLDPREIAGTDLPLVSLADRPPLSPSAMWKSERATRMINNVEQALSPNKWPALDDVMRHAAQYRARGWHKLAAFADSLAQGVGPTPQSAQRTGDGVWVAAAEKLIIGHASLARLEAARAEAHIRLESLARRAQASPLIKDKIEPFRARLPGEAELDSILPTDGAVERLASALESANVTASRFERLAPSLEETATRGRIYEVRGWRGAAKALEALIQRATPDQNPEQMERLAADLAATKVQADQVEARWKEIEARRALLQAAADRILATYPNFVASHKLDEHADLASLAKTLDRINADPAWAAAARRVAEPDWVQFDVLAFARKSEAHKQFVGRNVATADDLRKWL